MLTAIIFSYGQLMHYYCDMQKYTSFGGLRQLCTSYYSMASRHVTCYGLQLILSRPTDLKHSDICKYA